MSAIELTPEQWIALQAVEAEAAAAVAKLVTARRFLLIGANVDPDAYEPDLRQTPGGRLAFYPKNEESL